jgi:hypothetical protein
MGASRLQHAAQVLDVSVPFFFEGAPGGHKLDGSDPSPAYVGSSTNCRGPAVRRGNKRSRQTQNHAVDCGLRSSGEKAMGAPKPRVSTEIVPYIFYSRPARAAPARTATISWSMTLSHASPLPSRARRIVVADNTWATPRSTALASQQAVPAGPHVS